MRQPPLSLYVHLPWCERKCPYCDFNSHERQDLPEDVYVDRLLEDFEQEMQGEQRPLETLFIGGGTPSLFSVASIERLLADIRASATLADNAEITMEANPGSVESDRLNGYVGAGVNRFSLGVQSFQDEHLQRLGRVHNSENAIAATVSATHSGAASYNIDLMHGLPGQALEQGLSDLETAINTDAAHLSWYQLTIEPNTQFYSDPPLLPVEETLASLEEQGSKMLIAAGFERYEVSAWARPGQACRHNLNYWHFGDYLAIGAGAHGKVTSSDGEILRYSKTRNPEDYLANDGTGRRSQRRLNRDDRRGEFMLNALRLSEGFNQALFEERTGLALADIRTEIDGAIRDGLLTQLDGYYRCTGLGRRFLDDLVGRFFTGEP